MDQGNHPGPNELLRVLTADGARVTVKRKPIGGGRPVIFLHGLAVNADLWDLPEVELEGESEPNLSQACGIEVEGKLLLGEVRYSFTHHQARREVYVCRVEGTARVREPLRWVRPEELEKLPLTSAAVKSLRLVE